jgi:hypothetical protein
MTQTEHQNLTTGVHAALVQAERDLDTLAASDYRPTGGDLAIPTDIILGLRGLVLRMEQSQAPLTFPEVP